MNVEWLSSGGMFRASVSCDRCGDGQQEFGETEDEAKDGLLVLIREILGWHRTGDGGLHCPHCCGMGRKAGAA